ncbi:unannotated protein [freshwater metagenome]|uniref:Unannotated protein n=1 Tax=freshwater metagenome TaxID=449393 RepID=A0A6J6BD23_9ZZZZ
MVNVEHRCLTAFEQDRLAVREGFVEQQGRVAHQGAKSVRIRQQLVDDFVGRDRTAVVDLDEEVVFHVQRAVDLLTQDSFIEDVLDADPDAVDLVGVGGADSTTRRANLALSEESFRDLVEGAVIRGDDVSIGRHPKFRDVDTAAGQRVKFLEQNFEVDDNAVCDNGYDSLGENPRGQKVQRILFITNNDRVAGVVSAVEFDDVVDASRDEVGCLTLTFVTPLGSNDDYCGHVDSFDRRTFSVYRLATTCSLIQECMMMAAAADALSDRVDPNCSISTTRSLAAIASGDNPGPSWPNSSTHASGSEVSSIDTEPGMLSTPTTVRLWALAHSRNSSIVGW